MVADTLQTSLQPIVENLQPARLRPVMRRIFADLARLLGYLRLIESQLSQAAEPDEILLLFTTVHAEALVLLDFIEAHQAQIAAADDRLNDSLDSACFAIRHELNRVYQDELLHLHAGAEPEHAAAKLGEAHDALVDCFQQTTIVLARLYDTTIDGARLFDNIQTRREQSLLLWEDLLTLLQAVRLTQAEGTLSAVGALAAGLAEFQQRSLRFLMHKDWGPYMRFVEGVGRIQQPDEIKPALHPFECYLELLLDHVRRRAAFSDAH